MKAYPKGQNCRERKRNMLPIEKLLIPILLEFKVESSFLLKDNSTLQVLRFIENGIGNVTVKYRFCIFYVSHTYGILWA